MKLPLNNVPIQISPVAGNCDLSPQHAEAEAGEQVLLDEDAEHDHGQDAQSL